MHKSRTVAISEITDIFVPIIRLIYAHNEHDNEGTSYTSLPVINP